MTLEYRCSNCGALLETTNADPLDAENERLRAALQEIRDYNASIPIVTMRQIARRALEQQHHG